VGREIYYSFKHARDKQTSGTYINSYFQQLQRTSQPFEIIDGDTLQFVSEVERASNFDEDCFTLVVSVVGPQSAGKSFIMNYLFGTLFLSASGRCTKGVYGSVLTYKGKDNKDCRILIVDTEGIQSAEARDEKFDRQLIFYMICVSHVVLICNSGEMNTAMAEIVKLAADAKQNLREEIITNQSVYIILNKMTRVDEQARVESVGQLRRELIEIRQQNTLNDVLQIDVNNIFPLGQAFQTINFGPSSEKNVFTADKQF